ncbi:hypothetical protein JOM56_004770 [Amanita muscaria]
MASMSRLTANVSFPLTILTTSTSKFVSWRSSALPVPRCTSPTSNATARAREPFSTSLGLPICAEVTPSIEGTGGFFISDSRNPGKIYLVTARHVVFHLDNDSNELYQHRNSSQRPRNVLLFGDAAIEKHITAIESEIGGKHIIIEHLESRLENAEQSEIRSFLSWRRRVLVDISRDWKKWKNRVLGNVVPSPPIGFDVGEEGFTYTLAINSCISGTYL